MSLDSSNFSDNACSENCYDDELYGLQLKASNEEECDILSSLLQDSILHVHSHSFHEDKRCLRLILNRFCWELLDKNEKNKNEENNIKHDESREYDTSSGHFRSLQSSHPPHVSPYFRVHSGLYIHNVDKIIINDNFKKVKDERYLNLLALHACNDEINLLFAGHKNMCLKISKIDVHLKDLNQKYQTAICPQREL